MKNINLDVIDPLILNSVINSNEFKEFCNSLDELYLLTSNDLILEAVTGKGESKIRKINNIISNTKQTTKQVANVYDDITDSKAGLIKSTWDLVIKSIHLITKITGFIYKWIEKILKAINKGAIKINEIPENVRNKIKGNISLYISAEDIADLYNKDLILHISNFIELVTQLSKGDMWTTFFKGKRKQTVTNSENNFVARIITSNTDMKLCNEIDDELKRIKNLGFTKTTIEMSSQSVVDLYFGNNTAISFVDLHGKKHESTYIEALYDLSKELSIFVKPLENLQKDLGNKFSETQANGTFANLSHGQQKLVTNTIQNLSVGINVIGVILKYIMADINTMNKTIDKIYISMKKK